MTVLKYSQLSWKVTIWPILVSILVSNLSLVNSTKNCFSPDINLNKDLWKMPSKTDLYRTLTFYLQVQINGGRWYSNNDMVSALSRAFHSRNSAATYFWPQVRLSQTKGELQITPFSSETFQMHCLSYSFHWWGTF